MKSQPKNGTEKPSSSNADTNETPPNVGGFTSIVTGFLGLDSSTSFLGKFADDQRLERLEKCCELESDLDRCEAIREAVWRSSRSSSTRSSNNGSSRTGTDKREGSYTASPAQTFRISRFFGWGYDSAASNDGNDKEAIAKRSSQCPTTTNSATQAQTTSSSATSAPSCSRETHSVWACRALALGCGEHLIPLRKCLRETNSDTDDDGLHYDTTYSSSLDLPASSLDLPGGQQCALEQVALAKCVSVNLAILQRRLEKREGRIESNKD